MLFFKTKKMYIFKENGKDISNLFVSTNLSHHKNLEVLLYI